MKFNYKLDKLEIKSDQLFCILGPCVIEDESFTLQLASQLKEITTAVDIPFYF